MKFGFTLLFVLFVSPSIAAGYPCKLEIVKYGAAASSLREFHAVKLIDCLRLKFNIEKNVLVLRQKPGGPIAIRSGNTSTYYEVDTLDGLMLQMPEDDRNTAVQHLDQYISSSDLVDHGAILPGNLENLNLNDFLTSFPRTSGQ
ncbi:MAG: hypothetical protein ABJQ71_18885 [Roseibium sp.]